LIKYFAPTNLIKMGKWKENLGYKSLSFPEEKVEAKMKKARGDLSALFPLNFHLNKIRQKNLKNLDKVLHIFHRELLT
jgi:hypothetical protein